jgi:hypothetical protein
MRLTSHARAHDDVRQMNSKEARPPTPHNKQDDRRACRSGRLRLSVTAKFRGQVFALLLIEKGS